MADKISLCNACCLGGAGDNFAACCAPYLVVGAIQEMKDTSEVVDPCCDGCGSACVFDFFFSLCGVSPFFEAYVAQGKRKQCCDDTGLFCAFCEFAWCKPCAACRYYQITKKKTRKNSGDTILYTAANGNDARQLRENAQERE